MSGGRPARKSRCSSRSDYPNASTPAGRAAGTGSPASSNATTRRTMLRLFVYASSRWAAAFS